MELFNKFQLGEIDELGRRVLADFPYVQPTWAGASISDFDAAFISGLLTKISPYRIVEIGVASGWGSLVAMVALSKGGKQDFEYFGIDLFENYFMDPTYKTGQVIPDLAPQFHKNYILMTGESAAEAVSKIKSPIDFAFIDGHHMHPWATLDLLAILPKMRTNSWVALHDIALSSFDNQNHVNRGPKYLFEGWNSDRCHSIQQPAMIGAMKIENPDHHLNTVLEILYTPWETTIEWKFLEPILKSINFYFGKTRESEFKRAFELGNYYVNMMHRPNVEALDANSITHFFSKMKLIRSLKRIR